MKKTYFTLIFSLFLFQITYSNIDVGGIISSNQTWTLANSPYNFISDVQLAENITLTIEPGVTVNGNWYLLQIWGDFNAIGNEQNRIIFNDVNFRQGSNPTQNQNQKFNAIIQFCEINGGQLFNTSTGHIYGSLKILDNNISSVSNKMFLFFPKYDCFIERNIFSDCREIRITLTGGVKVYIRNNIFFQSFNPYSASSGHVVENMGCKWGSDVIVKFNSFLNTDRIILSLAPGYTETKITATNNFWGTTDESIIQSMIYDKNDDLNCAGYIPYQPYLTEPHQNTPLLGIKEYYTVSSFKLSNYPNPFNPSTTIRYGLEKDSHVKIEIYDISGKLISTLQNNYQTQGWHSVIWNGTNHQGEQIPTGLYFSKVTTDNDIKTIKLMLLK